MNMTINEINLEIARIGKELKKWEDLKKAMQAVCNHDWKKILGHPNNLTNEYTCPNCKAEKEE